MPGHLPEEPLVACAGQENLVKTCFFLGSAENGASIEPFAYPPTDGIKVWRDVGSKPVRVRVISSGRCTPDEMTTNFRIDPGARQDGSKEFGQCPTGGDEEQMTGIGVVRWSHKRARHLGRCEPEAFSVALMQASLDKQGVQEQLAKLLHLCMVRGFGGGIREGFRQFVEEKRILTDIELKIGTRYPPVP